MKEESKCKSLQLLKRAFFKDCNNNAEELSDIASKSKRWIYGKSCRNGQ